MWLQRRRGGAKGSVRARLRRTAKATEAATKLRRRCGWRRAKVKRRKLTRCRTRLRRHLQRLRRRYWRGTKAAKLRMHRLLLLWLRKQILCGSNRCYSVRTKVVEQILLLVHLRLRHRSGAEQTSLLLMKQLLLLLLMMLLLGKSLLLQVELLLLWLLKLLLLCSKLRVQLLRHLLWRSKSAKLVLREHLRRLVMHRLRLSLLSKRVKQTWRSSGGGVRGDRSRRRSSKCSKQILLRVVCCCRRWSRGGKCAKVDIWRATAATIRRGGGGG